MISTIASGQAAFDHIGISSLGDGSLPRLIGVVRAIRGLLGTHEGRYPEAPSTQSFRILSGFWFIFQASGSSFRLLVHLSGFWFIFQASGSSFRLLVHLSGFWFIFQASGSSFRLLVPKTIPFMVFGIRELKYWVIT